MNKKDKKILIKLLFLLIIGTFSFQAYGYYYQDTITIANWNLQIFGVTKASNETLMNFYVDKIENYDIIFIQEIRDASGIAFENLCEMLEKYECKISSRAGRSSSKEQYGVIYKEGINLISFYDYNPDELDRWERPPIKVEFKVNKNEFIIYNIHIKPSDVKQELVYLGGLIEDKGNVMLIGDLNAGCSYYNRKKENDFSKWHWIVKDNDDTTISKSYCAYDRIILNDFFYKKFLNYGIDKEGITPDISDHYLVWIELRV